MTQVRVQRPDGVCADCRTSLVEPDSPPATRTARGEWMCVVCFQRRQAALPTATIDASSPRAADWLEAYSTTTVPIQSPFVSLAELPGLGLCPVFFVDLARLSAEQLERAVALLSARFRIEPAELRKGLLADGLPILAEEMTVTVDPRVFDAIFRGAA